MIRQATLPLLFVLAPSLSPDPAVALERRLRRALSRRGHGNRGPLEIGSEAAPYEPGGGESPLSLLLKGEGLEVAVTAASPRIARELDLLVDLDRRHSVTVRLLVPVAKRPETAAKLEAAARLAAEGITVRLVLTPPAEPAPALAADLSDLVEAAREAGIYDVELSGSWRPADRPRLAAFDLLRLELGFPRALPGRG